MTSSTARWAAIRLAVLFCVLCPTLLLAQGTAGRIVGRVADPSGAVLANVKVTLVNEATGSSREALTSGPKTTRELALSVLAAKSLDTRDMVLAKAMAGRLIHALRMQAKRGKIAIAGKERGAIVWR